ncbi:tRNA pseudouridine(38-40) synthase TruA [Reichenbachiella agarivorans]|uniref:tRNA pseudouridine synthase A n=1 Tax=Reichenbachiella agarivorans TaxID=2979464 RepID=A0ABY6CK91_9BACT|nr:tRNA pseudouridine(38-40) synthase TruA [Reichenbachiella agarivorans]UXP30939.1 tRNA pseudouridine(38-40) synthase TruA [Reichenbachiella agarivorans]
MKRKYFFYLIEFQYLGYRYHGFQKQPNVKTIQLRLEKTLNHVLGHKEHKTLAAGRTDAMVSVNQSYFELFVQEELHTQEFFQELNKNLPSDIRALSIKQVDEKFNIIQHSKIKEYLYLFSFGAKNHPFAAPYICHIREPLDIPLMTEAASLYQGKHNFQNFVHKPSEKTVFEREILHSEIVINDIYTANFFPEQSYIFRVSGPGFMRYQVRMMVGALFSLGKGEIDLEEFKLSLIEKRKEPYTYIAPATGLVLNSVTY